MIRRIQAGGYGEARLGSEARGFVSVHIPRGDLFLLATVAQLRGDQLEVQPGDEAAAIAVRLRRIAAALTAAAATWATERTHPP